MRPGRWKVGEGSKITYLNMGQSFSACIIMSMRRLGGVTRVTVPVNVIGKPGRVFSAV